MMFWFCVCVEMCFGLVGAFLWNLRRTPDRAASWILAGSGVGLAIMITLLAIRFVL